MGRDVRRIIYTFFALALLPSLSPGQTVRDRVIENHYLYTPVGQGPFPAIVAMPGCSGISTSDPIIEESNPELDTDDLLFRRHYRLMAEKLRDHGFAVYLIDIHSAEGVLTACAGEIQRERIAKYVDESIAWIREQPTIENDRIHLIGWSMGGRGVLQWLHGPRQESNSVQSAIAVYPPCGGHPDLSISLPILIMLGGADDIADPLECEQLVRTSPVKEQIVVKNYPGARHGFDIADAPPIVDISNGMTIGYQQEAAEASWREIMTFLMANE